MASVFLQAEMAMAMMASAADVFMSGEARQMGRMRRRGNSFLKEGGVEGFIILTAHGHDPHQEALSTLRTIRATIRTVDIFTVRLEGEDARLPIHGGALDTSLLLYIDAGLVDLDDLRR